MELTFSQSDFDKLRTLCGEIPRWIVGSLENYVKIGIDMEGDFWLLTNRYSDVDDQGNHYDLHDPRIHLVQINWSQDGYVISRVSFLLPPMMVDYIKESLEG